MRVLSVFLILCFVFTSVVSIEYRSYDGSGNSYTDANRGKANIPFRRFANTNSYVDGISVPFAGPNVRDISNAVFGFNSTITPPSALGYTDFLTYWGQFIDHDMTLATLASPLDSMPITVPSCDQYFDPQCTGTKTIRFSRSQYDPTTGTTTPRQHINTISSYLDGSMIYGSDKSRADALRTMEGGQMLTTAGGALPPKNFYGFSMENFGTFPSTEIFFFGDIRGNENPALTSLQTLFLREHNRLATEIAAANPTYDDETIYQETRRRVIAHIQHITMNEYMPLIIGEALPQYGGYSLNADASIVTEFSTGAFRYGHSEVNAQIYRIDENLQEISAGHLSLRESYYNPTALDSGIEPILRGMAHQIQSEVDPFFVDDLRNFLFGQPGNGGMDLVAINTNRGRDHGIPLFNDIREIYGLSRLTDFESLTTNTQIVNALKSVYTSIDQCDLYVCGLAEDHAANANVGPTFKTVIKEQYLRTRNGDRFWYENGQFTTAELSNIQKTLLSDIILRNTDISSIQCYVMSKPDNCIRYKNGTGNNGGNTGNNGNYDFTVIVEIKTNHPDRGQGGAEGYTVNGVQGMELTLTRGIMYTFYADISCSHQLYISRDPNGYGSGIVSDGVTGSGCNQAVLKFLPSAKHPDLLYYQCLYHGNMGWKINIVDPAPITGGTTGAVTGATGATGSSTGNGSGATTGATTGVSSTGASTEVATTGLAPEGPTTTGSIGSTTGTSASCNGIVCNASLCQTATCESGICVIKNSESGVKCSYQNIEKDICFEGQCSVTGNCEPIDQKVESCKNLGSTTEAADVTSNSVTLKTAGLFVVLVMTVLCI